MNPIGLAALTVLELAPPDMVSCAAEVGFASIGLRLIPPTPDEVQHPMVGDTPLVRETARRLADTGLPVLDIELFRLKPETNVADFRVAIETGARLGAREALIAGNDPDESRLIDRFAAFCDLARECGMGANIEPMPWTDVKSFVHGVRIVERAGTDNGGVVIDPIHFDRGLSKPDEIANAPRARLRYMQFCDAPSERPRDTETLLIQARAERLMPGDGGLDVLGILRAVPSDIPIALEIPMRTLTQTMNARERTKLMLAKTRALIEQVDLERSPSPEPH